MDFSGSPPNSSESINGLTFGKKIYFEDVGIGIPSKLGGGSSSVSIPGDLAPPYGAAKKVKSGGSVSASGGSGQQVARCVVEGCNVDLSDLKAYYSRHKVCGMHSKSPKVIVAGMEQRFCQQCSRFHQLPEFDQGKRSCRRRLAGHNERRRKPPPGSLLPSRYGRLSSSVFENSGRGGGGGFVMDFSAHQRLPERELWPPTASSSRSPEGVHTSQTTATGNYPSNIAWQSNTTENHPSSNIFLQGSAGGPPASFPNTPGIPPGEFYTGVSADSGRALSLLSNHHHQSWGSSRIRASGMNNHLDENATTIAHPHPMAWDGSHQMAPDQDLNGQFSSGRQYMEVEHSRGYTSPTHHVHWSL